MVPERGEHRLSGRRAGAAGPRSHPRWLRRPVQAPGRHSGGPHPHALGAACAWRHHDGLHLAACRRAAEPRAAGGIRTTGHRLHLSLALAALSDSRTGGHHGGPRCIPPGTGKALVGRDLFQALEFSYPEPIERLVNGAGGANRLSMVRLRDALLATEVCVQHVAHNGRRLALVLINDTTEAFCVRSALDVAEHVALVTNSQGRVLAFNRAARAILPGVDIGAYVSRLVPQADAEPRWL